MKKQNIFYLIVGIVALILIAVGWYVYKYRDCIKKVSYVPPREQKSVFLDPLRGLRQGDKGDYYVFDSREFRTSDEAMRACIWK